MNFLVLTWAIPAAVSVVSLLVRKPWTLIPARRHQPPEFWSLPVFHEANMVITAMWTAYFAVAATITWRVPWMSLVLGFATWPLSRASQTFGEWYSRERLGREAAAPL
jgi:hypothetical protein